MKVLHNIKPPIKPPNLIILFGIISYLFYKKRKSR